MRKNTASQVVGSQMVSATDGLAFTGTVTVYITIDGGTQGIGTVGSGICTHEGNGFHSYAPSQAETNGDHLAFTFVGSGAVPVTVQAYTVSFDPHDMVRLGLTALPNAAADASGGLIISDAGGMDVDALAASVAAIEANTNELQADWADGGRLDLILDATALEATAQSILADTGTDLPATLATIAGYIDIEVAAIKAKTDNLPASPAAVGSAMTLADGSITDATITAPAESGPPTGVVGMLVWIAQRLGLRRVRKTSSAIEVYASNGTTVRTSNSYVSDGTTDDVSAAEAP